MSQLYVANTKTLYLELKTKIISHPCSFLWNTVLLFGTVASLFLWGLCGFILSSFLFFFFFFCQKVKITKEKSVKQTKEKESEDEEDKNNDCYLKQRDDPPTMSKHLQKKTKKQAKKQAKVGFDNYFTFINGVLATSAKTDSFCCLSLEGQETAHSLTQMYKHGKTSSICFFAPKKKHVL